ADTLEDIQTTEPPPPRALNRKVPRDLETACLKCLRKDPSRRYPDADALADDLGRFLTGEPIHARRAGRAADLWRWGRRHPAAAGSGVAVFALLLLMTAAAMLFAASYRGRWLAAEANRTAPLGGLDAIRRLVDADPAELTPSRVLTLRNVAIAELAATDAE